jgi:group I intron endonuclease
MRNNINTHKIVGGHGSATFPCHIKDYSTFITIKPIWRYLMNTYIIYKTINQLNGKYYVGQHYTSSNDGYLGSGTILNNAIKKYGKENFKREVLEFCTSANVNEQEIYWIAELSATNRSIGYNIAKGGNVHPRMFGNKNPMFNSKRFGKLNPMFGKKHSKETKKKISEIHKGKILSKEQKEKQRKIMTGKKHSKETKKKISESNKGKNIGKIRTEEFKINLSNKIKGRKYSKEHRNNISKSKIGENNPQSKWKYILSNEENFYDFFSKKDQHNIKSSMYRKNTNSIIYKNIKIIKELKNVKK